MRRWIERCSVDSAFLETQTRNQRLKHSLPPVRICHRDGALPGQDFGLENDTVWSIFRPTHPGHCADYSGATSCSPGPGICKSSPSKVKYNPKLSIIVITTIRPPVLKCRPCPSEKNSLFDNARRYVDVNTSKIPYAEYATSPD